MLRYVVASLCGLSLTGSVYMAGWGGHTGAEVCTDCCDTPAIAEATTPVTLAGKVQVKNTMCIVSTHDTGSMGGAKTVEYQGKVYNLCCSDCIESFNKEPEKYVKALNADPKKFGIK